MLNLQPAPAMNYEHTSTGEWLAHCVGCPVPEAANAFERAGIKLYIVNGLLGLTETPAISVADEVTANMPQAQRAWKQIEEWVRAAGVKRTLQHARFGFLGNNYSGMLDMYSDLPCSNPSLGCMWSCWKCATLTVSKSGGGGGNRRKARAGGRILYHQRGFPLRSHRAKAHGGTASLVLPSGRRAGTHGARI
jgi:L-arabinose isomerase